MFKKVRIVWNLTHKCPYNCPHCAANSNQRPSSDLPTKLRVLASILTVYQPLTIDFSGGDPLYEKENIPLIEMTAKILGTNNVSISTTGRSIKQLQSNQLRALAGNLDLTYDHYLGESPARTKDNEYLIDNYTQAFRAIADGLNLSVHLPIYPQSQSALDTLAKELSLIAPDEIGLLQLMPLGRNRRDPIKYYHKHADYLIERLKHHGYNGRIFKNCAMCGKCNGLSDSKLGLDPFGNLFWCIWAADLDLPPKENPFYLGNLLEEDLANIIDRITPTAESLDRSFCHVLNYIQAKNL